MMPFLMRKSHDGGLGGGGGKGKGKGKGSPKFWDLQYDMTETKRKGKTEKPRSIPLCIALVFICAKLEGEEEKKKIKRKNYHTKLFDHWTDS